MTKHTKKGGSHNKQNSKNGPKNKTSGSQNRRETYGKQALLGKVARVAAPGRRVLLPSAWPSGYGLWTVSVDTPQHTRRLAAIVFTDIVGFSKLTAGDEVKAIELLATQKQIVQ